MLNGPGDSSGYGSTEDHEPITTDEARAAARQRRRHEVPRRSRKYSEVVSVGAGSSVSRSLSMAYPRFMGPAVANSYRNPPPSYQQGTTFEKNGNGSEIDVQFFLLDPDHHTRS